jgi:hypothetical protein
MTQWLSPVIVVVCVAPNYFTGKGAAGQEFVYILQYTPVDEWMEEYDDFVEERKVWEHSLEIDIPSRREYMHFMKDEVS